MDKIANSVMTLRDRIFPSNPPHPGSLMQTAWISGWESQFVGLGSLTAFLSGHLQRFSAADDDLGLGLVFLQRHRAEVGLKLLLERAGGKQCPIHHLDKLRTACNRAFEDKGLSKDWACFCADQDEYLKLMQEIDPEGFTYRFPFDKKGLVRGS